MKSYLLDVNLFTPNLNLFLERHNIDIVKFSRIVFNFSKAINYHFYKDGIDFIGMYKKSGINIFTKNCNTHDKFQVKYFTKDFIIKDYSNDKCKQCHYAHYMIINDFEERYNIT